MSEALIGPNAIIQVAGAIRSQHDAARLDEVMQQAGLAHYVAKPPSSMVPETEVATLHRAVAGLIPAPQGEAIMREAGRNTALYLLANRIPALAQAVLKLLPAPLAARALLAAITRHAWTFAGSSRFSHDARHPVHISLEGSPLFATPECRSLAAAYFEATFETLFQTLVSRRTRAVSRPEAADENGAGRHHAACAFDLVWRP
ncbi:MAG: bacteriochlorophyll 4-vinyl reductase [Anderseniella sp.]|jgi:divinyl protochlorophyllide a 8-vinyl-reductase|nr:bacteriochlorophyll 4-vinyl reductase [Anderseniella sp.]